MGRWIKARDTINGAEGSAFITQNGRNIEIACLRNIVVQSAIQSNDMRVVGTRKIQEKISGVKLTGSGNVYYGTPIFSDMVLQYIRTGVMPEFDLQIVNNDPTTTVGTQNMIYTGCVLTGNIPLSVLNDEEAMLNFDFTFTVGDVAQIESFSEPTSYGGN